MLAATSGRGGWRAPSPTAPSTALTDRRGLQAALEALAATRCRARPKLSAAIVVADHDGRDPRLGRLGRPVRATRGAASST
jgi:hypothetical protein